MATIKKITGAVAAIALVTMVTILLFGFKVNAFKKQSDKFASVWFNVTAVGSTSGVYNLKTNQTIGSTFSGTPVEEEDPEGCAMENTARPCLINLEIPAAAGSYIGLTVQQALNAGATISTLESADGYARQFED